MTTGHGQHKAQRILELLRAKCCLLSGVVLTLLLISPHYATYAADELLTLHKLSPMSIPTVPVDDNPFQREVFSLKELKEGNKHLLQRVIETRMDFPLMFDPYGKFSRTLFKNPSRSRFGKNFSIIFSLRPSCWRQESLNALETLKNELVVQDIDRGRDDKEIRLDFLVFLKNWQTLREYVSGFPDLTEESRRELEDIFEEVFQVCARVLEFKTLTLNGIKGLDQIDTSNQADAGENEELQFERFVKESKGMRAKDISSILEIRNPAQFSELALERTAELLADADGENVVQLLRDIEPSDAIILASYFARDRIQAYKKPFNQMQDLYEGQYEEEDEVLQEGDCRYFAGLAIQYLNLIVKPDNQKLRHWHFGIAREDISDFHHAYVVAAHTYESGTREKIDLFFFDLVALSSRSLGKLNKRDIGRLVDAVSKDDHFFHIKRYGEDFVAQKHRPKNRLKDVPRARRQTDSTPFDTPLGNP